MSKLIKGISKLFTNKGTVTIFGFILCTIIIAFCYQNRINSAIKPIQVPYAKTAIAQGTQITEAMVGITKIPPAMLQGDVLRYSQDVIDKYTNADTAIPEGSLFYKRTVVEREDLPANIILDYPKGYVLYNMSVTTETTYGNSVYPGNYIDIYMKAEAKSLGATGTNSSDQKQVMVGKLLSNVKVISVRDSSGESVFEDTKKQKTPAMIIFAVPEEYFILLQKANYLRTYNTSLIPVPTNESLKEEPGELSMSSETLKEWINKTTIWTE